MKFKGMNFYKNLYNQINDIDVAKTAYGDKLTFTSETFVNDNDFSFALLYNYLLLKNDIDLEIEKATSNNTNAKNKEIELKDTTSEEFESDAQIYEDMCKFFNLPQKSKITLKNFFTLFNLSSDDFDEESIKVYNLAFNNVKKSCNKDFSMEA